MSRKLTREDLEEMSDNEVIEAGYCPTCYASLIREGGCTHCPSGHIDLCG